jgi:hypothetical protein
VNIVAADHDPAAAIEVTIHDPLQLRPMLAGCCFCFGVGFFFKADLSRSIS